MRGRGTSGATAAADVEEAVRRLRAMGCRITSTRRAVLDVVLGDERHRTAEQIAEAVHAMDAGVHRSTVYRTLEALEEAGVLTHVHLGHGSATYHLAGQRHHHAVCEKCGAVVELPTHFLDGAARWLAEEHGFDANPEHFAVVGRCTACRTVA
jgi:Fur family transcriptional regulator, ferric uptake regulator